MGQRSMVGSVGVPLQAKLKILWEEEVIRQVLCEAFHLYFSH